MQVTYTNIELTVGQFYKIIPREFFFQNVVGFILSLENKQKQTN